MKFSLKYVVASVLGAVAAVSAVTASADVVAPSAANGGNSELVLFVRNLNNPSEVYARGLGITLDSILTTSQVQSGPYTGPVQSLNFILPDVQPDAALTNFLAGGSSADFVWTVMTADTIGSATTVGNRRAVLTTSVDYPEDVEPGTTNQQLTSLFSAWATMVGELNGALPNSPGSSTATDGLWGQAGTSGEFATDWFGAGLATENAIGAANFYFLANSGATGAARFYELNGLRFSADGVLSAVPIPAALWLFGSGLLGLVGIGRRRAK